jgi:hypothetical protein
VKKDQTKTAGGYTDARNISEEDMAVCQDISDHAVRRVEQVFKDTFDLMPHPVGAYLVVRKTVVEVGKGFELFTSQGTGGVNSSGANNVRTGMALAMLEILVRSGNKEAAHIMQSRKRSQLADGRELCRMLSQMEL